MLRIAPGTISHAVECFCELNPNSSRQSDLQCCELERIQNCSIVFLPRNKVTTLISFGCELVLDAFDIKNNNNVTLLLFVLASGHSPTVGPDFVLAQKPYNFNYTESEKSTFP
eukprot:scpid72540/ scgid26424/ 